MPVNDFNTMQNQAIRYAREMQKRAAPQHDDCPQRSEPPEHNYTNAERIFGKQAHQTQDTPFCNSACPIKNIMGIGGNTGAQGDNDIMLLMALLLVLSSDGGDRMLMMALLYIMS